MADALIEIAAGVLACAGGAAIIGWLIGLAIKHAMPEPVETVAEPEPETDEWDPERIANDVDAWLRSIYRGEVSE